MSRATSMYVRNARIEKGWSQERTAGKAGVSRRALAAFEAGGNVSLDFLEKVIGALELSELPIGGKGEIRGLTTNGAIDAAGLIDIASQLVALADLVREIVLKAILPPSVQSGDSAAIASFISESRDLDRDDSGRVAEALRRFASDIMQQAPESHGTRASAKAERKRKA